MHYLLPALPLYVLSLGGQESDVGLIMGTFTITAVHAAALCRAAVWTAGGASPSCCLGR